MASVDKFIYPTFIKIIKFTNYAINPILVHRVCSTSFQIKGIIHSWHWNQWTGLFRTGSEDDSLVQNLFRSGVGT